MSSLHPRIAEVTTELRDAQAEMLALLETLPPEALHRTAPDGGWTVAQVVEHLQILEDSAGRLIGSMLKQLEGTVDTETDAIAPTMARFQVWKPVTKLTAPETVRPAGEAPTADCVAKQSAARDRLIGALEQGSGRALHAATFPHPFLGTLSGYQWALLVAQHQRRHLFQIRTIVGVAS
jgi:hypothetical protein